MVAGGNQALRTLSDLALANKQLISKRGSSEKKPGCCLVSVSKNNFGNEAPPGSVTKVDLWYRSVSATKLIAKYFSVHEPGIIRNKYSSTDQPALCRRKNGGKRAAVQTFRSLKRGAFAKRLDCGGFSTAICQSISPVPKLKYRVSTQSSLHPRICGTTSFAVWQTAASWSSPV